jgi:hypothetical protein
MLNFSIGDLYFWIQFADSDRLFLVPRALVFLGKNLESPSFPDMWYFQDAKSYCVYGPEDFLEPFEREVTEEEFAKIAGGTVPTTLVTLKEENLYQIVDCGGLAKAAADCASRRAKANTLS